MIARCQIWEGGVGGDFGVWSVGFTMKTLNDPTQSIHEPVLILRVAQWFLFLVLIIAGVGVMALYYAFEKIPVVDYELLAYGVGITLFVLAVAYYITGRRVTVYADRLVSTTRFSTKTATLDDVIGTVVTGDYFRVVLKSKKIIKVPWYLKNALLLRSQLNAMIAEREAD